MIFLFRFFHIRSVAHRRKTVQFFEISGKLELIADPDDFADFPNGVIGCFQQLRGIHIFFLQLKLIRRGASLFFEAPHEGSFRTHPRKLYDPFYGCFLMIHDEY